jgi:transmembrane sensor
MMSAGDDDPAERASREATAWFVRLNTPTATDADRRAFKDWLAADPAHGQAIAEVRQLWDDLGDPAAALAADGWHRRANARRRPHGWRGAAMSFALAAAAAVVAALWLDPGVVARAQADHATRPGERLDVALADGSKLFLDADSAVSESLGADGREVTILRGRVWFDVASDARRPFTVHADSLDVRVVGTAFGVDREEGLVTVDHGAVRVVQGDDERALTNGEQVRIASGRLGSLKRIDPAQALAWRRGLIVFDAAPLDDVILELERMAKGRVIAPQPEVRAMKLSGVFRAENPAALVEAMRHGLGLRVVSAPGVATLLYR